MKTLIVYYSLEGNTEWVAQKLAENTKADVLRLVPKKEYPKEGFKKFFWGGKSVVFGEKPVLEEYQLSLGDYDKIVIGSPIWAGSYTPPIKTFLADNKIEGKNIYLFICHSGGGAQKCFQKLSEELKNNKIISTIDFNNPKIKPDVNVEKQLKEFCNKINS